MTIYVTNATAIAMCDEIGDQMDSGEFRIYGGSVPADADAALGGATLLATIDFAAGAFPGATDAGGSASAQAAATTAETSATAGTATFWRLYTSGGTAIMQGVPADLTFSSTTIGSGDEVSFSTELTISVPES